MRRTATRPFIILCGRSGVGKTAVRKHLAAQMGAASLGPDDYDGDWTALYNDLDLSDRAVVECCRLPRALRRKVDERRAAIIELTATPTACRQRLIDRGEAPELADRRTLEDSADPGYGETVPIHMTFDTETHRAEDIARDIATSLEGTSWA